MSHKVNTHSHTSDQLIAEAMAYTEQNKQNRRTSMNLAGIEHVIPAMERQ